MSSLGQCDGCFHTCGAAACDQYSLDFLCRRDPGLGIQLLSHGRIH